MMYVCLVNLEADRISVSVSVSAPKLPEAQFRLRFRLRSRSQGRVSVSAETELRATETGRNWLTHVRRPSPSVYQIQARPVSASNGRLHRRSRQPARWTCTLLHE